MKRANWQRRLQGYAPMTAKQFAVLTYLADAKAQGWPFVPLEKVNPRTIRALFDEELIYISPEPTETRYKITDRGERTRKAYATPSRRTDGLCPDCGVRPVHYYSSGKRAGYCAECLSKLARREYKHRLYGPKEGRMCSRCGKRPVHVRKSGRRITYCLHCDTLIKRRGKKRWHKNKLKRIQGGEVLMCTRPGCTNPRHYTAKTVNELCLEHYREWHNDYRQRKRLEAMQAVQP